MGRWTTRARHLSPLVSCLCGTVLKLSHAPSLNLELLCCSPASRFWFSIVRNGYILELENSHFAYSNGIERSRANDFLSIVAWPVCHSCGQYSEGPIVGVDDSSTLPAGLCNGSTPF
jgi:hypothetical protein